MSLIETSLAAVIFSGAAGCSLQLWCLGTAWSQRLEQQHRVADELEAALVAGLAAAREAAAGSSNPAPSDCTAAAEQLAARIQAAPAGGAVQRLLERRGDAVLLQVRSGEPPLERQRWLHPAALGLCAAPLAPVGGGDGSP
ncbi:MAG: hypothetical protein VKJ66_03585 [Synechococcus sp.]|nr:hypothetical protein [Synechococcus sp.]